MRKKVLSLLLAAAMCVSITGCGQSAATSSESTSEVNSSNEQATVEETVAST